MILSRAGALLVGILVALVVAAPALAQGFPQKAVRIVVPYSVGLGPDVVVRAVADSLATTWKQPVVIENRPGASGIVALSEVHKVGTDGHTLFVGDAGSMAVNPYLFANLAYDPGRDFAPLSTLFRATFVIFTTGGGRFATLAELIAAAKAKPKGVSYASLGAGLQRRHLEPAIARHAPRQHHHRPRRVLGDGAQQGQAVDARHVDVERDHVGVGGDDQIATAAPVRGLARHLHAVAHQHRLDPPPRRRRVVDDHHPHRRRGHGATSSATAIRPCSPASCTG